jgi:hypothetical protein
MKRLIAKEGWRMTQPDFVHTCYVCGHRFLWNDAALWYGSLEQLEEGILVPVFCSTACAHEFEDRELKSG